VRNRRSPRTPGKDREPEREEQILRDLDVPGDRSSRDLAFAGDVGEFKTPAWAKLIASRNRVKAPTFRARPSSRTSSSM